MTANIKIDPLSKMLTINSQEAIFTELLKGNLDASTSQGALVRIMKGKNKKKYVTKLAFKNSGYSHLLNQLIRLQKMNKAKIRVVPQIVDYSVEKNYVYYTTSFIEGISGYTNYLRNSKGNDEFIKNFRDLLETLNTNLWLKGKFTSERKHFSKRHKYVVDRGIKSYESFIGSLPSDLRASILDTFDLKSYLTMIKVSTKKLDEMMSNSQIPKFSHGDLHLDNILVNKMGQIMLIDINGSKERAKSIIEFELARLLMSFFREVISGKHYAIVEALEGKIDIVLTQHGEEILQRRKLLYDEIFQNQNLSAWFKNKNQSKRIIKVMEALHFVNVFATRPKQEVFATYLLGTKILSQALKEAELES